MLREGYGRPSEGWRHPLYHAAVAPPASPPRLTVALTFDGDAISDAVRRGDSPVKLSHGEFGIRVGIPRILDLLEHKAIPATWFMPGHTMETWPSTTRAIV